MLPMLGYISSNAIQSANLNEKGGAYKKRKKKKKLRKVKMNQKKSNI